MKIGDRIGELEVVSELPLHMRTHAGRNREWLCVCSCNRQAVRTTSQLNNAKRNGVEPCCQVCLEELRSGYWYYRERHQPERFHRKLQYWGSLWSQFDEENLVEQIRDAMAEELGFYPEEPNVFHEHIPAPRGVECSSEELCIAEPNKELRMYWWLRWQLAVDFGMENWGNGLPRAAVEKMLYKHYMEDHILAPSV